MCYHERWDNIHFILQLDFTSLLAWNLLYRSLRKWNLHWCPRKFYLWLRSWICYYTSNASMYGYKRMRTVPRTLSRRKMYKHTWIISLWMPPRFGIDGRWEKLQGVYIMKKFKWILFSQKNVIQYHIFFTSFSGYWWMFPNQWNMFKWSMWKYDGSIPMYLRWRLQASRIRNQLCRRWRVRWGQWRLRRPLHKFPWIFFVCL